MENNELHANRKKKARLAGIGYLILALAALPDMLRRNLFVMGDAAASSRNILAKLPILRISILGDIFVELVFLLIALCLYNLLKGVRRGAARMMLLLVVMAVTMTIFNTGTEIGAIRLFEAGDQTNGILLLGLYQAFSIPASVFFGLWMLPLGYLFFNSGFMPKLLGILLMIGSSGYVIHAVFRIMVPAVSDQFVLLSVAAEVATIIWLLGFGVKRAG